MDKEQQAATDKVAEKQKQLLLDYQRTFQSEHGLRVLADLMSHCGMFRSSFAGDQSVHEMAFREGERNVALFILDKIETDIAKRTEMIRERLSNETV